ncbi:hypothetical protein [Acidovorax sp.]|uniref:phage tail tube protein n=1 Tax=Acidovorax sp. TaxID=1872122 RepID=UPI0025BA3720|nr:hypothetical protein [Acidovorax sp.]MCI5068421.1 hypothetical protein [Acidovorax sp.]
MANELAKAILGSGGVRLNLYDFVAQKYVGLGDLLEADKFEITPDAELKRKTSKSRSRYGQNIASAAIAKPTKIAITLSGLSAAALAMQYQGTLSQEAQGAGTLTDVTVVAKLDKWVSIGKRNIVETGFAVAPAAGGTAFEKDTDYVVDYANGRIKVLSAGAIDADAELDITGTFLAYNGLLVRGGTRAQIRAQVLFEGENQVDGQYVEVEAYEAVFMSNKGFDWLADDFNGIELEGELNVPEGKTEPYTIRMPNVEA